MRFGQIRDAIGGTARILGLVSFRQHLLPSRATGRTRHASRQSLVDYGKPLQATEAADAHAAGHRGAAARLPLRRVPLRPPPAGRLLRPGRRPEARRARQPPAALHPGPRDRRHGRGGGPRGARASSTASATRPIPGSAAASAGCARAATSTCAMRPRVLGVTVDGGYATHVLVPHPRYLLDVEGIAPEIAGALMCSGLTGYGAIKKALPYLRAGPAADRRPRRRRHDGAAVRPRAHRQADLRCRHRRGQARGGAEAGRGGGVRPGRRRRAQGHRARRPAAASARRSISPAPTSRSPSRTAPVAKGGAAIVVGLIGGSFSHAGADVPAARAHHHGQLRRLAPREAREMLDLVKAGKVAPIPVETRPLERDQPLARRPARRQDRRPRGDHAMKQSDHGDGPGRRRRLLRRAAGRGRQRRDVRRPRRASGGHAQERPAARQRASARCTSIPVQGGGRRARDRGGRCHHLRGQDARHRERRARACKPLVAKGAAVFTFQNGVESAERIGRIVGAGNVVPGVARIGSHISEPGVDQADRQVRPPRVRREPTASRAPARRPSSRSASVPASTPSSPPTSGASCG